MWSLVMVSEVFGPTVQGEGPSLGRRCAFVRLGRCNLTCSWCDTPYTWDWKGINGVQFDPRKELTEMSVDEVIDRLEPMAVDRVVVTGGEPLLQQTELVRLCEALVEGGCVVEIETNGTRAPSSELIALVERFNVSPKLANSGVAEKDRLNLEALRCFASTSTCFKFVATDRSCLDEIGELQAVLPLESASIWVMPEGTTAATLTSRAGELTDAVIGAGWNLTTRLHVMLWGDERGR
jgi:organic radical activating enzyme